MNKPLLPTRRLPPQTNGMVSITAFANVGKNQVANHLELPGIAKEICFANRCLNQQSIKGRIVRFQTTQIGQHV